MAATNGTGVDVVLNSLAGPLLKATWDCIARFGRFVEIGKVDLEAARRLDLTPFGRSATMAGFDLLQFNEYKGEIIKNALAESISLCRDQIIRPIHPITSYSISDMEKAMRQMQGGNHIGKLVLIPGPDDEVKVVSRQRPFSLRYPESTYMIVGGLGGIGRTIALWMIEKGAKNILIVSRSAASHPDAASLSQYAREYCCNLHIQSCDISDEKMLGKLLIDASGMMPPIRGVVQAAMHLDVSSLLLDCSFL
jgi:NADPH:quinone reductase-like Zn-dependent oxidoreductase